MNITPSNSYVTQPLATAVNPQTDALRRENNQREMIAQPAAASQSAGEKGVLSDKDRARTPGQQNEAINFTQLQEQSEKANKTISDQQSSQQDQQSSDNQSTEQQASNEKSEQTNSQGNSQGNFQDNNTDEKNSQGETALNKELDFTEQQQLAELKSRDLEVRTHEKAHSVAGGATTGAPSFSFQVGPDGKRYVIDGEVAVDISGVKGDPSATITKMQKVYSAALAPVNPSVQDTKVANAAAQLIAQAQSELLALQLDDPNKAEDINRVINNKENSAGDVETIATKEQKDTDAFVSKTLKAQDQVTQTRTSNVNQRASRIENFYANINHAYEKAPTSRFELRA